MFVFKIPDLNGGFLTKKLEGNKIITYDSDGKVLNVEDISLVKKGISTKFGVVKSYDDNFVILKKGIQERKTDRFLFNSYLLKSLGPEELEEFNKQHPRSQITGRFIPKNKTQLEFLYEEFKNNIVGTYKTPIGEIKIRPGDFNKIVALKGIGRDAFEKLAESGELDWTRIHGDVKRLEILKHFKEILTSPEKIYINKKKYFEGDFVFTKIKNKKKYYAAFTINDLLKTAGIFAGKYLAETLGEEVFPKGILSKSLNKIMPLFRLGRAEAFPNENINKESKIFNSIKKSLFEGNAAVSTDNWNREGGQKPGHKYIERRDKGIGPDGRHKYEYLYKMPSGKTYWADENGKKLRDNGKKEDTDYKLPEFEIGEPVSYGDKVGKVIDQSENFIAIKAGKETFAINKREHVQKINEVKTYRTNQIISYKDGKAKILELGDSLALVHDLKTNKYAVIKLEQELNKHKPEEDYNDVDSKHSHINKYSRVNQGYFDDDLNPETYEKQKGYIDFDKAADEAGMGRSKNDITREKYVKVGNEIRKVEWEYDPGTETTDFIIDGVRDYPLHYGGKKYFIRNITKDGYSLEDPNGKKGLLLSHDDYKDYLENEQKKEGKFNIIHNLAGDEIVSGPKYKFKFKPKYDNKLTEEEIDNENKTGKENLKATTDSKEYKNFKNEIETKGYKLSENLFIAKKNIEVDGKKFTLRKEFNKNNNEIQTQVDGPDNELILDNKSYQINDISKDEVFYKDGDEEKKISIDELRELNGKNVFSPTGAAKGLISKHPATKVYFGLDDKNAIPATYEIIEADDLITSHNANGEVNQKYSIKNAQNRDRTAKQSLAQINNIAQKPNFDFLADSRTAQEGAPIVNENYNAIAGNGRGIGIKLHYENPGSEQIYKQKLLENSEKLGFDKAEIEKFKNPVLVRKVNVDDKEAQRLGAISNQDNKLALENRETAKGMATRIDDKTFNKLSDIFSNAKGDFGSISDYLDSIGEDIVKELIRKDIIPENEKHLFYDQNSGKLNSSHKEKLKDLLVQGVLGDSSKEFERIPDASREGFTKSIGDLLSLKGKDGDLIPHMQEAIKILSKYNTVKENFKGTDDFISQDSNDAFEPLSAGKEALALFDLLSGTKPNEMKNKIREYKSSMEGDMFGPGLSPAEAFDSVFQPKYVKGINKSLLFMLRKGIRILIKKSIDKGKNYLAPSKKNPRVKRWQKQYSESDQPDMFKEKEDQKARAKENIELKPGMKKVIDSEEKTLNENYEWDGENNPNIHFKKEPWEITKKTFTGEDVNFESVSDNPKKWEYKNHEKLDNPQQTIKLGKYTYEYRPINDDEEMGAQLLGNIIAKDKDGKIVGDLTMGRNIIQENYEASVEVDPEYRRQGIATNMYDFGEKIIGGKFTPATSHTPYAEAFWKSRNHKILVEQALRDGKKVPAEVLKDYPDLVLKYKVNERKKNQIYSENFKKWFGDWEDDPDEASKAINSEGQPAIIYHGSDKEFNIFNKEKIGSSTDAGWLGEGFYFYEDEHEAKQYGSVKQFYLNVRNPYYATEEDNERLAELNDTVQSRKFSENLIKEGYDGVYFNGDLRGEWVVFNSEQIKSATGNDGSFDSRSPDITKSILPEKNNISSFK